MAKSVSEQARELATQLEVLRERDAARARELDRTQAEVRDLEAEVRREARTKLENEVSALKQQLADHIKHTDTSDTRRWGWWSHLWSRCSGRCVRSLRVSSSRSRASDVRPEFVLHLNAAARVPMGKP